MERDEQELCWKYQGRRFAEARGVPVAELLQGPYRASSLIDPDRDEWVAKPNKGCTSRGVIVAQKNAAGGYRNHMGQNIEGWTSDRQWEEWVTWMYWIMDRAEGTNGSFPDEWIIEARIGSGPDLPTEYGVYCIYGEPQFIRQVDLGGHRPGSRSRVCNWTPEGEHAGTVLVGPRKETPLEAPPQRELLLEYARTLSADWPGPFVRVDFLQGASGPVFSELTPRPAGGKITLVTSWDRKMGEAWHRGLQTNVMSHQRERLDAFMATRQGYFPRVP